MRRIREQALPASDLPATFTQYADDTTAHQNERSSVEETVRVCEPVFSDDNLKLNVAKTQYFTVTKEDDSWKSVKLLGSMLGTAEDIAARVSAANRAFAGIPWKRHNLNSRLCMFSCLILPVLLYNCALWTLSQTLTDVVNVCRGVRRSPPGVVPMPTDEPTFHTIVSHGVSAYSPQTG